MEPVLATPDRTWALSEAGADGGRERTTKLAGQGVLIGTALLMQQDLHGAA